MKNFLAIVAIILLMPIWIPLLVLACVIILAVAKIVLVIGGAFLVVFALAILLLMAVEETEYANKTTDARSSGTD